MNAEDGQYGCGTFESSGAGKVLTGVKVDSTQSEGGPFQMQKEVDSRGVGAKVA